MSRVSSGLIPAAAPTRLDREEAEAVREAVDAVIERGPWVGGPAVQDFESAFAHASGLPHLVGVGNGTDALAIAMRALGLPAGSSVLVAANEGGYASVAARMVGLVPRVMDVSEATMGPTAALAELAWTSGVSAVVATHLHGDPLDIVELDAWRRGRDLLLIEDCAQAHGARRDGHAVGTTGDAAAFSFYPTKNLGAIGDAGAVGFRDAAAADRARHLREYGWDERHRVQQPDGRNSRLDSLQAAVLRARLPWLEGRNARRREIANRFRDAALDGELRFAGDRELTVAHHAVVITPRRDDLQDHLRARGIATAIHYPFLVQEMAGLDVEDATTPNAARLRDRILSLPCFPELRDDEVDQIAAALSEWGSP